MIHTPRSSALARLGQLAAAGFALFLIDANRNFSMLTSSENSIPSETQIAEFGKSDDPAATWMMDNLGSIAVSDIEDTKLNEMLPTGENCTLITDIYNGNRFALLLSHTSETLGENDIKEARAAALVLQMEADLDADLEISQKEIVYLKRASSGASDDEIAEDLQLSLRAVKERKRKAIDDLEAKNIGHAVGIAKRRGLI